MSEALPTLEEMGPIPWQCWDIPGFKACHTEAGHETHRQLVSVGGKPGTAAWNEVYPVQYRRNVRKCEILHGCQKDLIQTHLRKEQGGQTDADILARLRQHDGQEKSSTSKWLVAAAVLGVGFFAYTRMKR